MRCDSCGPDRSTETAASGAVLYVNSVINSVINSVNEEIARGGRSSWRASREEHEARMPAVDGVDGLDEDEMVDVEYSGVANRLKIMCGLTPVSFLEGTSGTFKVASRGRPYTATCRFGAREEWLQVTLAETD